MIISACIIGNGRRSLIRVCVCVCVWVCKAFDISLCNHVHYFFVMIISVFIISNGRRCLISVWVGVQSF